MGPDNSGTLAAVRPRTCNGDWVFTVAGFYWNSHQDGMEFAIKDAVQHDLGELGNIVDATYENPTFKWDYGFKLGVGYNTTCDGWDFGVVWTSYHGKAYAHPETEQDDNHILLTLWSNFVASNGNATNATYTVPTHATDIEATWNLNLDLVDIELGRESWLSKRVTIRPHVGIRIAKICQNYDIEHRGGAFSLPNPRLNDKVSIDNDFKGVGLRGGLDTVWNFGCGWAVYGNTALSLIYGRFSIDHDEKTREASTSFSKNTFFETKDSFRATRLAVDLGLGIQWSALFCDCQYAFTAKLGWENHLFLDQNQMWRVTKILGSSGATPNFDNGLPQNVYGQSRGDLDTQGWTLTLVFDF